MRTTRRYFGLLILALFVSGFQGSIHGAEPLSEEHYRADVALENFLETYWSQSQDYLRAEYPGSAPTGYWTFAQGLDALLDGVERTDGQRFLGLVDTLIQAQARRGWTASHYDDESWMALALLRAHELTGRADYLEFARELFADIREAWDDGCCGDSPGGVWWDRAHTQKATASNAGPVIAGARLARVTEDDSHLEFARTVYDHWLAHMVDPVTFQVTDHIEPDGTEVYWKFTYNEGLMIGASLELYRTLGESRYLETSRNIAGFLLENEVESTESGDVLSDGDASECTGDCHAFKGPAFRYLAELYEETGDPEYFELLRASAEAIWQSGAVGPPLLFPVDWTERQLAGPFSEPQMAAAVMALNIFARLTGPYPEASTPTGRYEAEEATIYRVGLEARHRGYSGWGYVAGWEGLGQGLDFHLHVPHPGLHMLHFRYSADLTHATRALYVNGEPIHAGLRFDRTGSWANYAIRPLAIELPAGDDVVLSLVYDSASSVGYLNLDYLELEFRPVFRRGDSNVDGEVNITDAIVILRHLFLGDPAQLPCQKSADTDDGGTLQITDAVYFLRYLFSAGPPLPVPHACGVDETPDALGCDSFPPCE